MPVEFLYFLTLVGIFIVSCFALKLPASIAMMLASFVTLIVSGNGLNIRHMFEGSFAFIDTILIIVTAMIFMRFVQESGGLDALIYVIIKHFRKIPVLLLPVLMLFAMLPAMITGSSTASVLTAGAIVAPILIALGVPLHKAGAFIAMAAVLGMIAPPVNLPAMIIGSGVDMPFVGFAAPLLLMTIPPAIIFSWVFSLKYARKKVSWEELSSKLNPEAYEKHGISLFIPLFVVVIFIVLSQLIPEIFGRGGLQVFFLVSALPGIFVGKKFNPLKAAKDAVADALPVMAILAGVGMFLQIMTLTGVRGLIVVSALSVNPALLYLVIGVSIPLFGVVSAFGSASVFGVPFLLALMAVGGVDPIIVVAALSLIAGMGDFMPPTALAAIFASQIIGEPKYSRVLKKLIIPGVLVVIWALMFVIFSQEIRSLVPFL